MMNRSEAEEHLRVIRSLMEKATVYRAVSAPTAFLGGMISLITGLLLAFPFREAAVHPAWFFGPWLGVLVITGAANFHFLRRDAERRGDPFFSPGMKMALKALAPAHLVAAMATALLLMGAMGLYGTPVHLLLPVIWCVAYGLGLLAMEHFAPRSLVFLGWGFLVAGLAACAVLFFAAPAALPPAVSLTQMANLAMAGTFGLFHLVYAVCAWPRSAHAALGVLA